MPEAAGLPAKRYVLPLSSCVGPWPVSAYSMPPTVEDLTVLRIVVREGFSAAASVLSLTRHRISG